MSNLRIPIFTLCTMAAFALAACSQNTAPETSATETISAAEVVMPAQRFFTADQFTYANYQEVVVKHADLDLDVNFDRKVLDGHVTLTFERLKPGAQTLTLDTKDLVIKGAALPMEDSWVLAEYTMSDPDPVLGSAMTIEVGADSTELRIFYETSPEAEGLQWLTPAQTAGKEKPYLFSQAQALYARTMLPVQDTPAVRMTYDAKLRVPDGLLPLMSASQDGQDADGNWNFSMPQPIPSYLIAIAVGDIKFKAINDTIGVYAESYILDASAEEFAETPQMEIANTELYGPYLWGRYDLIVLPPSFPFGGMENPRLSFMTPTLIAGDKSLTNVVAHELAHSWSGNLVTNSNWRDAWLNEGFTSYVENRVMEALYGERRAVMEQVLDMEGLKRAIAEAKRPELTHLKLPDDMEHPDDAFTLVSYIKGANFLFFLEDRFGRAAFDPFLKSYFNAYAFDSITTEDFLGFLDANLRNKFPDAVTDAEINAWVYGPGLPDTARKPVSEAFTEVDAASSRWTSGELAAADLPTAAWSTHEWLHFLNGLPELTQAQYAELDAAFNLTGTQNAETAFAWYMQAIKGNYEPAMPALEEFLMTVGRGKFIYRLYSALHNSGREDLQLWAQDIFEAAKPGYHPIAQRRISDILAD
jgi:aminopeptidase N